MLLIKNGTVYTMESEQPEKLDILLDEEGKIAAIDHKIEADCEIIDAQGCNVYPGLVEAHCHLGLEEAGIGFEGNDVNEMIDPITPQVRVIDGINIMDESVRLANEHGIVSVCAAPGSANVLGGQVSVYKTVGSCIDDAIIKENAAMKCAFGENPKRVYRDSKIKTRMGTASLLRETLIKAKNYMALKEFADDISKMPTYDMKLEALIPVLNKKIPLKAHAHRADDILTSIRIAKEFDLDMTLDHCTEGHLIVDKIVESGFPAIVGPSLTHKSKFELQNKTFKTPAVLQQAGIKIAITTDSPVIPQEYLPLCAGLAVKSGLDEMEALKAITIHAAEIIGVADRVGSLKVGKDGDVVICDGNIMDVQTNVLYTIVDGKISYQKG
ncbi:MAG: amidohydrolase [Erysipelotrichia bacterium]|nr:amidohydrolase [Erysipelotrichia bacterium]NCC55152.1 amidohydrolase [Erysipelotrichia bacterium]